MIYKPLLIGVNLYSTQPKYINTYSSSNIDNNDKHYNAYRTIRRQTQWKTNKIMKVVKLAMRAKYKKMVIGYAI